MTKIFPAVDNNLEKIGGSDVVGYEAKVERLERFQSLQSGQYWKAIEDIPEQAILKGDSLLIESIRWAEDKMHTLILRAHPRHYDHQVALPSKDGSYKSYRTLKNHSFLFQEFCNAFIFSPDAQASREAEVARIQQQIAAKQLELTSTASNPQKLQMVAIEILNERERAEAIGKDEAMLPAVIDHDSMRLASASLGTAVSEGISEQQVKDMQAAAKKMSQIAQIQSEWISGQTQELTGLLHSMSPYLSEVAAASLASTEDVRKHVDNLLEGITSLDLYTGKDVVVTQLASGEPAPFEAKLTFTQKLMYVDEELAVHLAVDEWFDFNKNPLFFEALAKNEKLVNQIFPSQRCVVAMATTRRTINYRDVWEQAHKDPMNAAVFLLVRNGQNLHLVISPVESHLSTHRLFPSIDELERPFKGVDGEKISYNDIRYTRSVEAHNNKAMHYKRMLILCAGLDHRLQLFGDFYDRKQASKFVSMQFQEDHFNFVHDDDGSGLIANPEHQNRPSLQAYIDWCNSHLRSGARVMCHWTALINPDTAPGAVKETPDDKYSRYYINYHPEREEEIVVARTAGEDTVVDMAVSRYSSARHSHDTVNIKVSLNKFSGNWDEGERTLPYLVLDAVNPDDLEWYINNRFVRKNHLYYIKLFKETVSRLRAERESEAPIREKLLSAMEAGNVSQPEERAEIVERSVIAWRAANRGAPLQEAMESTKSWENLLDQMYLIGGKAAQLLPEIEALYSGMGYTPLRLIVTSRGKLGVYLAPHETECDNRAEPHKWVHLAIIESTRRGLKETSRGWSSLGNHFCGETTIHEWPEAKTWAGQISVFGTYNQKQKVFAFVDENVIGLKKFKDESTLNDVIESWKVAYDKINLKGRSSGQVRTPIMIVPVGICVSNNKFSYVYLGSMTPHRLIYDSLKSEETKEALLNEYCTWYADKDAASRIFFRNKHQQRLSIFTTDTKPEDGGIFSTNTNFEFDLIYSGNDHKVLEDINSLDAKWKAYEFIGKIKPNLWKEVRPLLWLHDSLKDVAGNPELDKACGMLTVNESSVDLIRMVMPKTGNNEDRPTVNESGNQLPYTEWVDVVPSGTSEQVCLEGISVTGYLFERYPFESMSEAMFYLLNKKLDFYKESSNGWGSQKISPEGVTRWIMRGSSKW